jgi:predicted transglutaminase-like cysteine proteinase
MNGTRLVQGVREAVSHRRAWLRLCLDYLANGDVWAKEPMALKSRRFGSPYDFNHYLAGESAVRLKTVAEILAWLGTCEYASDDAFFQTRDFWQHPLTFEQTRRSDCEDFALWAWRKFGEIGLPARFFIGQYVPYAEPPTFHAWVTFEDRCDEWLLEGAARDPLTRAIRLRDVRDRYSPHYSIGHFGDGMVYGGLLQYLEAERARRRMKRVLSNVTQDDADAAWWVG